MNPTPQVSAPQLETNKVLANHEVHFISVIHLQAVQKSQLKLAHHVTGRLIAGLVAPGWDTVVSMSIAKAAAFDNKVVDGVMISGEDSGTRMFGLAGTRLTLQQTDSQVGDHELVLSSRSVRIHRAPGRQGSIDHLKIKGQDRKLLLFHL